MGFSEGVRVKLLEFRCHFREVGRATVPANTGRHGGQPYFCQMASFLRRLDWTFAASGDAYMKSL
jgi:hypothetical protein